jgi:hypothetical protein
MLFGLVSAGMEIRVGFARRCATCKWELCERNAAEQRTEVGKAAKFEFRREAYPEREA